jgi:hypothetical protein
MGTTLQVLSLLVRLRKYTTASPISTTKCLIDIFRLGRLESKKSSRPLHTY